MIETFGYRDVKAIKDKKCTLCGEIIHKGEIYERWVSKDASFFDVIQAHKQCCSLLDEYLDGEKEFDISSFQDWMKEDSE